LAPLSRPDCHIVADAGPFGQIALNLLAASRDQYKRAVYALDTGGIGANEGGTSTHRGFAVRPFGEG
jgi:hypothetical protein